MTSKSKAITLLIFVLALQCKEQGPEVTALKHRDVKISSEEKSRIKKVLEAKDGLNLGIFLKVIPANIDQAPDTERVVAYRKAGYERFTVLKPKGETFIQLKGEVFGSRKYQIVDIKPINLVSPAADSILTVVRGTSLEEINKTNQVYTHFVGGELKVILDKDVIMADAAGRYLLPLDKSIKLNTSFEDTHGSFAREFIISWQEKQFENIVKRKVHYHFQNGTYRFLPVEDEKPSVPVPVPEEVIAEPEPVKKKEKAVVNKKAIKTIIKSCEKIFKQVRKQCYDEVFDEKIDPDTDCEKTAREARAACEMG